MDYSVTGSYDLTAEETQALVAVGATTWIIALIISVLMIVAMWKIFTKAGKPGWHSIIPFLNMYDLVEISGYNGWMFLLFCIPFANIVMLILVFLGLAKNFGKSTGFAIGLIFLSVIFLLILAFDSSVYNKVQ